MEKNTSDKGNDEPKSFWSINILCIYSFSAFDAIFSSVSLILLIIEKEKEKIIAIGCLHPTSLNMASLRRR